MPNRFETRLDALLDGHDLVKQRDICAMIVQVAKHRMRGLSEQIANENLLTSAGLTDLDREAVRTRISARYEADKPEDDLDLA